MILLRATPWLGVSVVRSKILLLGVGLKLRAKGQVHGFSQYLCGWYQRINRSRGFPNGAFTQHLSASSAVSAVRFGLLLLGIGLAARSPKLEASRCIFLNVYAAGNNLTTAGEVFKMTLLPAISSAFSVVNAVAFGFGLDLPRS